MNSKPGSIFEPLITLLGLAATFVGILIPLFNKELLGALFIDVSVIQLYAVIAFLLALAVIWYFMEHYPYYLNLGRRKKRKRDYEEPWLSVPMISLIPILVIIEALLVYGFILLKNWPNVYTAAIQGIVYLAFFLLMVSIFAVLLRETTNKHNAEYERENFGQRVFQSLEKSRLVQPGIEIYENSRVNWSEANRENIDQMSKKIKLKTIPQKAEIIEVYTSYDGKEIYKVIKKQETT